MPEPTILDTILEHKRDEVRSRQSVRSLADLRHLAADQEPARGFASHLQHQSIGLIAEVKKASPTAGLIREDFDPVAIAEIYEANGANCLSVLTDERFFQGSDRYLREIKNTVRIPVLRKDFVVDSYQIDEARALGADAVLLIVSALSENEVRAYQDRAHELGMDALVEVHTESEMEVALKAGAGLIGINSRNLSTFVTDLSTVTRLASMVSTGTILVAESGIKTPADVATVRAAGAHAILVGETLMRARDIGAACRTLMQRT